MDIVGAIRQLLLQNKPCQDDRYGVMGYDGYGLSGFMCHTVYPACEHIDVIRKRAYRDTSGSVIQFINI